LKAAPEDNKLTNGRRSVAVLVFTLVMMPAFVNLDRRLNALRGMYVERC
jgi:hypothetical protein